MAHSPGGEIGTLYANENPRRLVWAVLVDASIPSVFTDEQTAQMVATFPREMETRDKEGRTMAALFAVFPPCSTSSTPCAGRTIFPPR